MNPGQRKFRPARDGSKRIRVMLVDESPDFVAVLRLFIDGAGDMETVACVVGHAALLGELALRSPDVAVVDGAASVGTPFSAIKAASVAFPGVRIVAYSARDDRETIDGAIDAGAWGFLSKHEPLDRMIEVIRGVADGLVMIGPR